MKNVLEVILTFSDLLVKVINADAWFWKKLGISNEKAVLFLYYRYMAPEYASSGKLTDRSDVFSFGIVLLELITGKRPIDPSNIMEDSLVEWVRSWSQVLILSFIASTIPRF